MIDVQDNIILTFIGMVLGFMVGITIRRGARPLSEAEMRSRLVEMEVERSRREKAKEKVDEEIRACVQKETDR